MARVIAIANQKGGVAKTTTAIGLGSSLAAAEYRCLVIDVDPQGNATSGLGVDPTLPKTSLYDVLLNAEPLASATVRRVHLPFLDVVPTTQQLAGAEIELVGVPEREFRLRNALLQIQDIYDFILIDCPPSLGLLTLNALTAAQSVIIPVQPEFFALEGLSQLTTNLRLVQQQLNPELRLEGVLLTMVDPRLRLCQQVSQEITDFFGERTFRTQIPRNVTLAEAPGFGKPVVVYNILSRGAQSYMALARELSRRYFPEQSRRQQPIAV